MVKVKIDKVFALTYHGELNNAQSNGYTIMTPSMFGLVPYKPCFNYAILSTTEQDFQGKLRLDLWHKGSASTIVKPKHIFSGSYGLLSPVSKEYQCKPFTVTIPSGRNGE